MTKKQMTAKEEYEFYKDPKNLESKGPPVRRKTNLSAVVPMRFSEDDLAEIRALAEADDRSLSAWIRRAVLKELERQRHAS